MKRLLAGVVLALAMAAPRTAPAQPINPSTTLNMYLERNLAEHWQWWSYPTANTDPSPARFSWWDSPICNPGGPCALPVATCSYDNTLPVPLPVDPWSPINALDCIAPQNGFFHLAHVPSSPFDAYDTPNWLANLTQGLTYGGGTQSYNLSGVAYAMANFSTSDPNSPTMQFTQLNTSITLDSDGHEVMNYEFANPVAPVPEPASMVLLGTGLIGIAGVLRRARRTRAG